MLHSQLQRLSKLSLIPSLSDPLLYNGDNKPCCTSVRTM